MTSNTIAIKRGWLYKEKSNATPFGGNTNRRWFEIERSSQNDELLLAYYHQPPSPDEEGVPRMSKGGWIFLSDVQSVSEDAIGHWIEIRHPTRTFRVKTDSRADHNSWFQALAELCNPDTKELKCLETLKPMWSGASTKSAETAQEGEVTKHGELDMQEENESRAQTEINFLRRLQGAPLLEGCPLAEAEVDIPAAPPPSCDCRTDSSSDCATDSPIGGVMPNSSSTTTRIDRSHNRMHRTESPLHHRLGRAIEGNGNPREIQPIHGKQRGKPPWHIRLVLDDSTSSDEVNSGPSSNHTLEYKHNNPLVDTMAQDDVVGGLERFLIETDRQGLLPVSPLTATWSVNTSDKKPLDTPSVISKPKPKTKSKYGPGVIPDDNFATEAWDDNSSF